MPQIRTSYDPVSLRNRPPEHLINSQERFGKPATMHLDFEMVRDTAHLRMSLQQLKKERNNNTQT